jgi:hypothetical protein
VLKQTVDTIRGLADKEICDFIDRSPVACVIMGAKLSLCIGIGLLVIIILCYAFSLNYD